MLPVCERSRLIEGQGHIWSERQCVCDEMLLDLSLIVFLYACMCVSLFLMSSPQTVIDNLILYVVLLRMNDVRMCELT